jgi:23S rRNA pseudouridine2605 synthase
VWLADKSGEGFKTGRSTLRIVHRGRDKTILEIMIREGRNRQVRRMLAALGHKVRDLTRIRMGPLTLEGLAPGQFRELSAREVKELQKLSRHAEESTDNPRPGKFAGKESKPIPHRNRPARGE